MRRLSLRLSFSVQANVSHLRLQEIPLPMNAKAESIRGCHQRLMFETKLETILMCGLWPRIRLLPVHASPGPVNYIGICLLYYSQIVSHFVTRL